MLSSELDILYIDNKIRDNFKKEIEKVSDYKKRLENINSIYNNENLNRKIKSNLKKSYEYLEKYINDLENQYNYRFYIMETFSCIKKYKDIIKTPIKINFIGKTVKDDKEKENIVNNYFNIASKYIDIELEQENPITNISCSNCNNKKDFDIIDINTYLCTKCYAIQMVMRHNSSYNDIDRVNISSKYMYDPKIHFRDCIKQYQGKQNCSIPDKLYEELIKQFELHHLLYGNKNTPKKIRFKDITKKHVLIFLKDLNYPKHYENVHLIHYVLSGKKPDDISYIEDKLLDDFDILIDLYNKRFKHIKRKNFINTQYVLYQLLCRHKHPCNKEEFIILKTVDRKFFHDEICKVLFEELGWNHTPFF